MRTNRCLPLSVVVHIDYQRARASFQRFGDVKKLITQNHRPDAERLFRDIAHKKTMLQLLHERDEIQTEARNELRDRFRGFDIECVDVLIGKPVAPGRKTKIETLLEQLRLRQLSIEQLEPSIGSGGFGEAQVAQRGASPGGGQVQLTNAKAEVQIAESRGEAELARARNQSEQMIVTADGELGPGETTGRTNRRDGGGPCQRKVPGRPRRRAKGPPDPGLSEASVVMRRSRPTRPAALCRGHSRRTVRQQRPAAGAAADVHQRRQWRFRHAVGRAARHAARPDPQREDRTRSIADSPEAANWKSESEKLTRDA